MQETLRTFVALVLPTESIDRLTGLQEGLKSHGLKLSWVRPQNLHLTMKFLGAVQGPALPGVTAAVQKAAGQYPPLNLVLQGMGVFPGIKRPRVLWTGLGGDSQQLRSLFADLETGLERLGFSRDKRSFRAHITLARIRKSVGPNRMLQANEDVGRFTPLPFVARRMVIFKSDLRPRGAVYTPLAEAVLAQGPGQRVAGGKDGVSPTAGDDSVRQTGAAMRTNNQS